jgi:hypothetical protein
MKQLFRDKFRDRDHADRHGSRRFELSRQKMAPLCMNMTQFTQKQTLSTVLDMRGRVLKMLACIINSSIENCNQGHALVQGQLPRGHLCL